jgi:hypothetical protein
MKKLILFSLLLTSCTAKYHYFPTSQIYKGEKDDIIKKYPETKEYFGGNNMQKVKRNKTWREYQKYLFETKNQHPI